MVSVKFIVLLIIAGIVSYISYGLFATVPLPDIDLEEWWGPEELKLKQDTSIRPFRVNFTEPVIKDLKYRLRSLRPLPQTLKGINSEYGFNSKELDNWVKYWAEKYDFGEREKYINQFPQYKTNIQGLDIHFVRVKAKDTANKEVIPLLILHGWPGTPLEFYDAIRDLIAVSKDRDYVLEVIAPSLPGYGFSDAAIRPGLGPDKMAIIFRNLMHRLGYKKYYLQGGDFGAITASNMATFFPNEVLGYHSNAVYVHTPLIFFITLLGSIYPPMVMRADVVDRVYPLSKLLTLYLEESGYFHLQATKPDTVGVALSDSPAGLAAYMLEKISIGTRFEHKYLADGGLPMFYTKDQLLDNIMVYWITNSMTSAMRIYSETFNKRYVGLRMNDIPTPVPVCVMQTRCEVTYLPPWLIRLKYPNLLNESVVPDGGHFIAMEAPKLFARDLLEAVSTIREWRRSKGRTEL
ncbi:juvenile hormone epoxide hydrolase-like [Epargyreus clarus]|uniref:juvenile hormone epoxide hydrolase-like n=1 Tax=Epargyreus clarus TaxID=520877 RepID=UPI003C30A22C